MTTANWLTLLFGSGIVTGVIGAICRYLNKKIKANDTKTEAVCYGVQALLRDRLYELYDKYYESKGYAPVWVKNNFEHMYKRYHALGENGVMDQHYAEFMRLPDKPVNNEEVSI